MGSSRRVDRTEPALLALSDEAYRLALCLVARPAVATRLCLEALDGVRGRRLGSLRPAVRAAVRLAVMRRVVCAARTASVARWCDGPLPELAALEPCARELLALEMACGLRPRDAGRVLRLDAPTAHRVRRTAIGELLTRGESARRARGA